MTENAMNFPPPPSLGLFRSNTIGITIVVELFNGDSLECDFGGRETLSEMQAQIEERTGIPIAEQVISHEGHVIDDNGYALVDRFSNRASVQVTRSQQSSAPVQLSSASLLGAPLSASSSSAFLAPPAPLGSLSLRRTFSEFTHVTLRFVNANNSTMSLNIESRQQTIGTLRQEAVNWLKQHNVPTDHAVVVIRYQGKELTAQTDQDPVASVFDSNYPEVEVEHRLI